MINAKEEPDLDFTTAVEVTAFVANVKDGEPGESCNCGKDSLKDIHIEVVGNKADRNEKSKYVIFEISPNLEEVLGDKGSVKSQIEGQWVKFRGYLTYDYVHRGNSYN